MCIYIYIYTYIDIHVIISIIYIYIYIYIYIHRHILFEAPGAAPMPIPEISYLFLSNAKNVQIRNTEVLDGWKTPSSSLAPH